MSRHSGDISACRIEVFFIKKKGDLLYIARCCIYIAQCVLNYAGRWTFQRAYSFTFKPTPVQLLAISHSAITARRLFKVFIHIICVLLSTAKYLCRNPCLIPKYLSIKIRRRRNRFKTCLSRIKGRCSNQCCSKL